VARRFVPWYDERFVGYRKNKVVHLLYLSTGGIQFVVHPRAFTVHSPHPRARTWKVTHKTGLWDQVCQQQVAGFATHPLPATAFPSACHTPTTSTVNVPCPCWCLHCRGSPCLICPPACPQSLPCSSPPPAMPCLQLAEIYDHAKSGMERGSYIPAAMYSCGEHTAGPMLASSLTLGTAVA
jgi:hypothetical protein